ncbi:MAG TPA: GldG family protein [Polyangiaceae bacterium]|nr:GldG family protein [Polyangiaceae bacterium]
MKGAKRLWGWLSKRPAASGANAAAPGPTSGAAPVSGAAPTAPAQRGLGRQLSVWSAVGVLSASVIAVCLNVVVARHYRRWDVTREQLYTLSPATLETLAGLSEEVQVLVFLSQSDPDLGSVRRMLDQYGAQSPLLHARFVDPDREPGEFLALQNRYRLMQGRTEQGRLVSDAAIVVVQGEARWVIGAEDIVSYDDARGTVQPRLEQALTEGLRQVLQPRQTDACFTHGQQEASMDDGGPSGLGGLRYTLEKNNYTTREVDLLSAGADLTLANCDLVVVAAPGQPYSEAAVARLIGAVRHGKNFLISISPILGEDNRTTKSGLEPLLALFGVRPRQQLIFERDPDLALPLGAGGEVFFAQPKAHAITRGLIKDGEARFRVVLQVAQGFELDGKAAPLLTTSEKSFGVRDASVLAAPKGAALDTLAHDSEGPFVVGAAAELPPLAAQLSGNPQPGAAPAASPSRGSAPEQHGSRLVVLGSSAPLLGNTWQDATLAGTRRFVESAISWVAARPALVSLSDKPERRVDLRFTEQAMTQIARYVLLYMPATALALASLVLLRRRSARANARAAEARS